MRKSFALFGMLLLLAGCSRSQNEQVSRYHDDGREKPVVVVAPVYDRHSVEMPWNLAEDLTFTIRNKMLKRNTMYLTASDHTVSVESLLEEGKNPFVGETKWISDQFKEGEFVAFVELVEHKIHERTPTNSIFEVVTPDYVLNAKMRVRIFDLRGIEPTLVLQEIINQSHLIPTQIATMNFKQARWGRKTYGITPLGIAHSLLCKETAKRIEDYVLLAKSRSHAK
ncbi:MAG: hypothetical protein P0S94_04985 [Simkaniaceae bacterium]|nr:hypothetical protein [Simkaniaceae bacterium]